ncbi:AfsR/SARP family transcriptional regulator [Cryobacterium roopkundense]|uniref:DNA-binding SARP family transcriptional activator n=1 Tax=Cryobacterium roopkundense TaxID=1001240 RepID=A0A7W9E371_9MICO|nr:BTAD domain-containing putative transcriptional regulator [Cryobacterium roopkundense]MBB5640761.1 DNA-binding SARP family transcriptional activator [Cryobacterium roopkundense]
MHTIVPRWNLTLLGYWQLNHEGQAMDVGARQQRVITSLALLGVRPRHFIATLLWPDGSEIQAAGNLRASLFRISHELPSLLCTTEPLRLGDDVAVDVHRLRRLIGTIMDSRDTVVPRTTMEHLRTAELLPGWYEDWVVCEQELLQHERVDALEVVAKRYLAHGDSGHALGAARAAAAIEPLRESVQLLLVRAHLAADNQASAVRVYQDFCATLRRELGVAPSPRFAALLSHELPVAGRATSTAGRRASLRAR